MAANPGPETIGVDELKTLETNVLKALCLTINTAGSELKYKILDSLSDDDFYFPVLRELFRTLAEMHRRGDYVISANLEEEFQKGGTEIPLGFGIESFFDGTLPSLSELSGWVARLKERSRSGLVPTVKPPMREPVTPIPTGSDATVVKSVEEVKRRIADERRKSSPAVARPPVKPTKLPEVKSAPAIPIQKVENAPPRSAAAPKSKPPITPPPAIQPPPTPLPREKSSPSVTPTKKMVLSSEGEDWSSYLEDLASQQGKTYHTGFSKLDAELSGLAPGLMLLVDEERDRVVSFLKQLVDQVASSGPELCLFVAVERSKSALRLRTLARLGGVPVSDLEKGRLKKDSADWQRIDAAGRRAAGWLKRVFVYEAEGEIDLAVVRELTKKLLGSSEGASSVVVIDALEKVSGRGGSNSAAVSDLKTLASSLDVLILAATTDPTLLASRDADYASVFRQVSPSVVELEVLRAGRETSTIVRFRYEPELCRFTEV